MKKINWEQINVEMKYYVNAEEKTIEFSQSALGGVWIKIDFR